MIAVLVIHPIDLPLKIMPMRTGLHHEAMIVIGSVARSDTLASMSTSLLKCPENSAPDC